MKQLLARWLRRRAPVVAACLDDARRAFDAGNLDDAYRIASALAQDPAHAADATCVVARVLLARGQPERAEQAIRSVAAGKSTAALQQELGNALSMLGRNAEALQAFRDSMRLDPQSPAGRLALARQLQATGSLQDALDAIAPSLEASPVDVEAVVCAHDLYLAMGRPAEALQLLELMSGRNHVSAEINGRLATGYFAKGDLAKALEIVEQQLLHTPDSPALLHLGGVVLRRTGQFAAAAGKLGRASRLQPQNVAILGDLGLAQRALGQDEEALDNFQLAAHYAPNEGNVRANLVFELHRQKRHDEVRRECLAWTTSHPDDPDAWFWRGKLDEEDDAIDAASDAFGKALALAPASAPILTNLGLVRLRQGRAAEAVDLQRRATVLAPRDAGIHLNLGFALQCAGDIPGALGQYELSLRLAPDDGITQLHLSIAHLTNGDFGQGWNHYDKRWLRDTASARRARLPEWQGEPLNGRRLLIWGEQAPGDQVMFASCVPDVSVQAAACVLECNPRILDLFRRSFRNCRVVGGNSQEDLDRTLEANPCDVQIPIGSLPKFTRRSWYAFPRHGGYLLPDPDAAGRWADRLATLPGRLKVGLSWRGGLPKTRQLLRSQPLVSWAPILNIAQVDFISLQYTPCLQEIEQARSALGATVWHWQEAIDDLDQTAALMSQLDVVITVCNTAVHFAGALNVPAWVMTPFIPEWRYLAEGDAMPWYPSVTLIRQAQAQSWANVIEAARIRLLAQLQHAK